MDSLSDTALESNKCMKTNFTGGDLSSDAGLLLAKEFIFKLSFDQILKSEFKTNDPAMFRIHKNYENLWQMMYQILVKRYNKAVTVSIRQWKNLLMSIINHVRPHSFNGYRTPYQARIASKKETDIF